ncbi:MAG: PQQ-dependent sugar dehydrogenase [Planctomycetaceae bacterium]|nr:PQQ-dependent sugar dehydrogenase [Planctomycetaceae bacterium]
MKAVFCLIVCTVPAGLWLLNSREIEAESGAATIGLPRTFTAVDTSRVMGSPDPWPLVAVRVFPRLTFDRPVELTHAGDGNGRLFVVEQRGVIRVFQNDDGAAEAATFLDIHDVVLRDGNEEGLLGLAFHPKYADNGQFFVYYSNKTPDVPRQSIVSRFRVSADDPNKADRASEEVLLRIPQPYANHNGGSIKFGPDGKLYIGLGDGGLRDDPHQNAQNKSALLGKILRIDVDSRDAELAYAVPKDNPFVGEVDALGNTARGEVWALGFRNPWRLSFDRKTGELWTADVGQDRFEEVNLVERGGNYGWNHREGAHDFYPNDAEKQSELIEPRAEYFHDEGGSVTGGLVYRGGELRGFDGAYFYGDFESGNVWTVRVKDDPAASGRRKVDSEQVARTELSIAAFGEDQAGEMYLCSFDGGIYRLRPPGIDRAAVAEAFPKKLSETGLFASVADNRMAEGVVPYELNVPFWSDYAVKDRYVALPKAGTVRFAPEKKWEFPLGTVLVKTFWLHRDRSKFADGVLSDPVRTETRLLVRAEEGWVGYTYIYNDEQTDAELAPRDGAQTTFKVKTATGEYDQPYYFPSRADCLGCHTKAENFVLGLNTRQMNREIAYHGDSEHQLALWEKLGLFTAKLEKPAAEFAAYPSWGFGNFDRSGPSATTEKSGKRSEPQGDVETQARAWLDVNCAMCHQPQSVAPGNGDLRFHTPLARTFFVNKAPGEIRRRVEGVSLIAPGRPDKSELLSRTSLRGERQMPPLATHLIDPTGDAVLRKWIAGLKPETAPIESR